MKTDMESIQNKINILIVEMLCLANCYRFSLQISCDNNKEHFPDM